MNNPNERAWFRSPLLMNSDDTAVLVVDLQEKLVPHILDHAKVVWNVTRLLRAAKVLGVRILGTEQYPKGLGATVPEVSGLMEGAELTEKLMFSCRECSSLLDELETHQVRNVLLCGIETHVCVAQTALDLIANGFNVFLCVDAVGSRFSLDQDVALQRMECAGATLTTTEAAMFEWCESAGSDSFKSISKLVQEPAP